MPPFDANLERSSHAARGYSGFPSAYPQSGEEFLGSLKTEYGSLQSWWGLTKSAFTYLAPVVAIGSGGMLAGGRLFEWIARTRPNLLQRGGGVLNRGNFQLTFDELTSAWLWTGIFRARNGDESYGEASAKDCGEGIMARTFLNKSLQRVTGGPVNQHFVRFVMMPGFMALGGWLAEATIESKKSYREFMTASWGWELGYRFVGAFSMMHVQSNLLRLPKLAGLPSLHADDWSFVRRETLRQQWPLALGSPLLERGGERGFSQQFAYAPALTILPTLEIIFHGIKEAVQRPAPEVDPRMRERGWQEAFVGATRIENEGEAAEVIHYLLRDSGLPRDDQMGNFVRGILRRFPWNNSLKGLVDRQYHSLIQQWIGGRRKIVRATPDVEESVTDPREREAIQRRMDELMPRRTPEQALDEILRNPGDYNKDDVQIFLGCLLSADWQTLHRIGWGLHGSPFDDLDPTRRPLLIEEDPDVQMMRLALHPVRLKRIIELVTPEIAFICLLQRSSCEVPEEDPRTPLPQLNFLLTHHPDAVKKIVTDLYSYVGLDLDIAYEGKNFRDFMLPSPDDPPDLILRKLELAPLFVASLAEDFHDAQAELFLRAFNARIDRLAVQLTLAFTDVDPALDGVRAAVGSALLRFSENLVQARRTLWNSCDYAREKFDREYGSYFKALDNLSLRLAEHAVPAVFHLAVVHQNVSHLIPTLRWIMQTKPLLCREGVAKFWKMFSIFPSATRLEIESRLAEFQTQDSFRALYITLALASVNEKALVFAGELLPRLSLQDDRALFSRWEKLMIEFGAAFGIARHTLDSVDLTDRSAEVHIQRLEVEFRNNLLGPLVDVVGLNADEAAAFRASYERHPEVWWREDLIKHIALVSQFSEPLGREALKRLVLQLSRAEIREGRFVTDRYDYLRKIYGDVFVDQFAENRRYELDEVAASRERKSEEERQSSLYRETLAELEQLWITVGPTVAETEREIDHVFEVETIDLRLPAPQQREKQSQIRNKLARLVHDLRDGNPVEQKDLQAILSFFQRDLGPFHTEIDTTLVESIGVFKRLLRYTEEINRFPVSESAPDGYIEVTDDPGLMFTRGNYPSKTCHRTTERKNFNFNGEIPNPVFLGQFKLLRLILTENGERVEGRMLVEISGPPEAPVLRGTNLYSNGFRLAELMQAAVRLYGGQLGISKERIFLPDEQETKGTKPPIPIDPRDHFPGMFALLRE